MDATTKKSILIVGGIIIFLIIYYQYNRCECEKRISYSNVNLNDGIDKGTLYKKVDSRLLNNIKQEWKLAGNQIDSFVIETQFNYITNRPINIINQYSNGQKHYGAVVYPKNYDTHKKYPLILWAEGLNQVKPSVNIYNSTVNKIISQSEDYFILIPSFRGQALITNNRRFCSDGFFGDAFDGATDDALNFLNLTKNNIDNIDENRICIVGISRGGTVALLMGSRDSTISSVVSISGPTNFYSEKAFNRYGKQYKYQFLSRSKSIDNIRKKMIKSSPIFFIKDYPNSILLIHGKNDSVVNISHAKAIIDKLSGKDNFEFVLNENGHNFYDWDMVVNWIKNNT
ncbi:dipeptidyl aminopeptidase/acylaminoacyl peptidase [Saonia flava]|uniref:Dipeptidyl aminopeptidase/acylaminoacyl peptidase n=1 Tax=Saonia flava TaxID=523696 RepID=A0A846QZF0_9FLAO|nr:prolyl oligopeptidase family serine peptidase [Saonia flava]NJB72022.1 dipeptidyl aminopeptidase/acylaminoacyl peptidase [Saonia flava]